MLGVRWDAVWQQSVADRTRFENQTGEFNVPGLHSESQWRVLISFSYLGWRGQSAGVNTLIQSYYQSVKLTFIWL